MEQVGVTRLTFPRTRHAKGMPQIEGQEAVWHGRLRYGALVHVQHEHPFEVQCACLRQSHHLKALIGLAEEIDALISQQAFGHVSNFLGCGQRPVCVLQPFEHSHHRTEPPPACRNPRHFSCVVLR